MSGWTHTAAGATVGSGERTMKHLLPIGVAAVLCGCASMTAPRTAAEAACIEHARTGAPMAEPGVRPVTTSNGPPVPGVDHSDGLDRIEAGARMQRHGYERCMAAQAA
jgi:predicted phage tail protein